jgi:hypothetical protein
MRGPVWPVAAVAACAAAIGVIGADALWPVLLGGEIAHGRLPTSIPFATAPSADWANVPAGAELVLWGLYHLLGGDRGVVVGQSIAAAAGFAALAAGLRREASDRAVAVICLFVLAGSLPLVVGERRLALLARRPAAPAAALEARATAPTARIWWAVPLLAVWGSLHGAVLAAGRLALHSSSSARDATLQALGVLPPGLRRYSSTRRRGRRRATTPGSLRRTRRRRGRALVAAGADLFGIALVVIVAGFALVVVRRGGGPVSGRASRSPGSPGRRARGAQRPWLLPGCIRRPLLSSA